MVDWLGDEGYLVNRKRVQRFMRVMGIVPVYPKKKPSQANRVYPYQLRHPKVDRPNQVWATDITYIPMARGFLYLYVAELRVVGTIDFMAAKCKTTVRIPGTGVAADR